jgi:hypothetical protein
MKRSMLVAATFGAALTMFGGAARADGMAIKAAAIPEAARKALAQDIAAAKTTAPQVFAAVRNVQGVHREVYKHYRRPAPEPERELRALGPAALLPMIEALAFDAPPRDELTDAEWTALTVGMVQSVGLLRDARSGPVLRAVFDAATHPQVQRAAAKAMGRLCTDAELAVLVKQSSTNTVESKRISAIEGLGECKRIESAKHLSSLLAAKPDDATAEVIAAALGAVGSSWAWKAMGPQAEPTGIAVREVAATALVGGFARHAAPRLRFEKSLQLVEWAQTPNLITKARATADATTREALDGLAQRFARKMSR